MQKLNEGECVKLRTGETAASAANVARSHGHHYLTFERHAWHFSPNIPRGVAIVIAACRLLPVFYVDGIHGRIGVDSVSDAFSGGWINIAEGNRIVLSPKGLAVPFNFVENKRAGSVLSGLEVGDYLLTSKMFASHVATYANRTGASMLFDSGAIYRYPFTVPRQIARSLLAVHRFSPVCRFGDRLVSKRDGTVAPRVLVTDLLSGRWVYVDEAGLVHLTPLGRSVPCRLRTDLST